MFLQLIPIPAFAVVVVDVSLRRNGRRRGDENKSVLNPTLDAVCFARFNNRLQTGFAYEVTLKLFATAKHSLVRISV